MWIKCLKVKYSKKEAETALNRILSHDRKYRWKKRGRRESRVYHCPICNSHHLTSRDFETQWLKMENREEFFKQLKSKIEVIDDSSLY